MRIWSSWNRTRRGAAVGIACALFCWYINDSILIRSAENWALDNCFVFRGERPTTAPVVIIGIDDRTLRSLGKPLAFGSPELAEVVSYLSGAGAAAIGIDFLIPEDVDSRDYFKAGSEGDAESLGIAIAQAGNVVLPEWQLEGKWLRPLYQWTVKHQIDPAWTDFGFVNMTTDDDGFIRSQQLLAAHPETGVEPQFALAVFGQAHKAELTAERLQKPRLELGGEPIPLDASGRMNINYVGPAGAIDTVSFQDVLAAARDVSPSPRPWKDKIVLIGVTAYSQPDRHPTPYANQSITRLLSTMIGWHKADTTPGTEIHANIIATLHDRAFITTPWWLSTGPLLMIVGAALGASFCRTSLEFGALIAFIHHFAWKVVTVLAFSYGHWRVEMVSMFVLGIMVYGVTFALRWRLIRRMMGMVKSEAVARVLERGSLRLQGEEREITVLFSDIRNFTSYSERHSAPHVVRLLNTYFAVVVPAIEAAGGIVNQYIGDGLMVIFGAPETQPDHAHRAVTAALAIVHKVHEYRQRWDDLGADEFEVGVGICTGKAVVGTIGSPRRLDYTAIGDTVNTAARIESGNKDLGTEILIAESTFLALPAAVRERLFPQPDRRQLLVKGKREPLFVYSLSAAAPTLTTSVAVPAISKTVN